MCGIVGYVGAKNPTETVFAGLKKLEYRGYDSSGIAAFFEGKITSVKAAGKLDQLEQKLTEFSVSSQLAIGHTRWATHGIPNETNAHPHLSNQLALVHNGIIENYKELKEDLVKKGYLFLSETDTEVIAHLLADEISQKTSIKDALISCLAKLQGAYALGFIHESAPSKVFLAKQGSPLVIGVGQKETYFGSDITIFAEVAKRAIFLNDGELACIDANSVELWDKTGKPKTIKHKIIEWTPGSADKRGYRHFMLKEIHEQPSVISKTIELFLNENGLNSQALGIDQLKLDELKDIHIVACGTAYLAGYTAKYYLENLTGLRVNIELASEFRYREPYLGNPGESLVIAVSQSGETADTLACIKHAKENACQTFSICNVSYASIPRETDSSLHMGAGPEIGVASTKAFTSQVLCLYLWALAFAQKKNRIDAGKLDAILSELHHLPVLLDAVLASEEKIKHLVNDYYESPNFLFVGRGSSYIIAMEGALKLKEISYIHAEAYAAGELKHGPIALVDHHMPIVAIVPKDNYYDKTLSNIEEICAREGRVIAISSQSDKSLEAICEVVITCPTTSNPIFQSILSVVPTQLLAYYIAVKRGTDVDQPRNLAKSVTVE